MRTGPLDGIAILAIGHGEAKGCAAYRKLSDEICEIKRLFVPVRFQGQGIGRRLCETLFTAAKARGYRRMRLDTGNLLTEAIAMYESMGFKRIPPYHDYPPALMPYLVFMEKSLSEGG